MSLRELQYAIPKDTQERGIILGMKHIVINIVNSAAKLASEEAGVIPLGLRLM